MVYDLAGCLLIAAAMFKAIDVSQARAWFHWPLILLESCFGLVLILGKPSRRIQVAGTLAFSLLAIEAGRLTWQGFNSCGCFGAVPVPPMVTFILDIAFAGAITLLPIAGRVSAPIRTSVIGAMALIATLFLMPSFLKPSPNALAAATTAPTTSQSSSGPTFSLTLGVSDEVIADLKTIAPDRISHLTLEVRNPFDQIVTARVDEIECICTRIIDAPKTIAAKDSAKFLIEFHSPSENMRYSKFIRLWTNAPAGNSLKLIIKAEVTN